MRVASVPEERNTMRVLALDTSTAACSVAIRDSERPGDSLAASRFEAMERGQSEALAPMVHAVLEESGLTVRDMDVLTVTIGPGAFTGVRIGMAMARALGVSSGLPVRGISTLVSVAHGIPPEERAGAWVLVVMDTKRDDVYVQAFNPDLIPVAEPEIVTLDALPEVIARIPGGEDVLVAGDAVARAKASFDGLGDHIKLRTDILLPDAAVVSELSMAMGMPEDGLAPPSPLYLRPPYAKISPTGGKLRP